VFLATEHHHGTQIEYDLSGNFQEVVLEYYPAILDLKLFSVLANILVELFYRGKHLLKVLIEICQLKAAPKLLVL
jgi:hypothetical protein